MFLKLLKPFEKFENNKKKVFPFWLGQELFRTFSYFCYFSVLESTPIDCDEVRNQQQEATIESGFYLIQAPGLLKRRVYCNFTEQETWTTISRRINGEENFNRSWVEYKNGFGMANGDHWIGNEMLYQLTNANNYSLRITMGGFIGRKISSYKSFKLEDEASSYRLKLGEYDSANSNGGDSFFPNASCNKNRDKDAPFSTYDHGIAKNCSKTLSGGWWFTDCGCSNLNGKFSFVNDPQKPPANKGIYWDSLPFGPMGYRFSLRKAIIEIQRI